MSTTCYELYWKLSDEKICAKIVSKLWQNCGKITDTAAPSREKFSVCTNCGNFRYFPIQWRNWPIWREKFSNFQPMINFSSSFPPTARFLFPYFPTLWTFNWIFRLILMYCAMCIRILYTVVYTIQNRFRIIWHYWHFLQRTLGPWPLAS